MCLFLCGCSTNKKQSDTIEETQESFSETVLATENTEVPIEESLGEDVRFIADEVETQASETTLPATKPTQSNSSNSNSYSNKHATTPSQTQPSVPQDPTTQPSTTEAPVTQPPATEAPVQDSLSPNENETDRVM